MKFFLRVVQGFRLVVPAALHSNGPSLVGASGGEMEVTVRTGAHLMARSFVHWLLFGRERWVDY